MANQNVGTPRFYVDILSWLKAHGLISYHAHGFVTTSPALDFIGINPTKYGQFWGGNGNNDYIVYNTTYPLKDLMPVNKNFTMYLGHNFGSAEATAWISAGTSPHLSVTNNELINVTNAGSITNNYIIRDGFTICVGNEADNIHSNLLQFRFDWKHYASTGETAYNDLDGSGNSLLELGSFLYGTYYEMPNAPNLSLTMSREYGGTKEFTTYNGSSISNTMWSKPANWGNLGAWELGSSNPALSRSGRRTWDLKFSYMDDSDLWGSNQLLSYEAVDVSLSAGYSAEDLLHWDPDVNDDTTFKYNLLTEDNFFSQVWHKTLGGTLPFIFQPDKDNINADQFSICRFKKDTLKATETAPGLYDSSLKLEEVW